MRLESYKNQEATAKKKLEDIRNIAHKIKMANAVNQVNDIIRRIDIETFNLVVVGEFSSGKSTFVNALLGRKILPSSKNPTTAIISKIVYGDKPAYRLFYKNKRHTDLTEAEFKKITAPPEPDDSDITSVQEYAEAQKAISEIDFAEIIQPLQFCKDKVEVVDTPGTNDLDVGRMEITYRYLGQADAVILIFKAYQPLSASEVQFLQERILGNRIQDIFFVISHKDDLDDAEQERNVVDFITQHLREVLPADVNLRNRIFLVNSLGALYFHMRERGEELTAKQEMKVPEKFSDTGFPDFELALGDFLADEKGMVRLKKYNRDAQSIIYTMQHDISVNIAIVAHSADEIRQKAGELLPKFQQAKRQAERIISDMQMSFESAGSDIDYKCHTAANAMLSKAKEAVEKLTKDMPSTAMQQAIEREVTAEKKKFIDTTLKEWQDIFNRENEKIERALREIWHDIDVEYQRSFNLPAVVDNETSLTISEDNNEESFSKQAYAFAGDMFRSVEREDNILGVIGGIGMGVIAGAVGVVADIFSAFFGNKRETWRDKIRAEVVRTYSGQGEKIAKVMKTLYKEKTEALCRDIQGSVNARIADMEWQLQNILSEKESKEQDAERKKSYLLSKQAELNKISGELNRLVL